MNNFFRAGKPKISLPIPLANLLDFNVEHAKLSVNYTVYGSIHPVVRELGLVKVKVHVLGRETK